MRGKTVKVEYTGGGRGQGPSLFREDPETGELVYFERGKESGCSPLLAAVLDEEAGYEVKGEVPKAAKEALRAMRSGRASEVAAKEAAEETQEKRKRGGAGRSTQKTDPSSTSEAASTADQPKGSGDLSNG